MPGTVLKLSSKRTAWLLLEAKEVVASLDTCSDGEARPGTSLATACSRGVASEWLFR